jgi:uncharacterized membrane protein YhfC
MVLLSFSIVFALLVTIGLPVLAGFWLNKRLKVTWQTIVLGALGYFIVQALLTLLYTAFIALMQTEGTQVLNESNELIQLAVSVLLAALLGVILRWVGMKFSKLPLTSLEASFGIGLGFGSAESISRVGLPLLMTFITMLRYINPQTSALDPDIIAQLEALWQVSPWVPAAGSVERILALVLHNAITVLVLQTFIRKNGLWLAAAIGLEVLINGIILSLSLAEMAYGWVILIALVLLAGILALLNHLQAFNLTPTEGSGQEIE